MELRTHITLPFIEDHQLVYSEQTEEKLFLIIDLKTESAACPRCQHTSRRKHCRYTRYVKDLAYAATPVEIQVLSNKWVCNSTDCEIRVFTERIPWLNPYQRRTVRLEEVLEKIAFSTNCLIGEKVCEALHIPVSHDTLLNIVKKRSTHSGVHPFRGN